MTPEFDRVLQAALALPPGDRAALAARLLDSLAAPDAAVDTAWADEAERRLAAYRRGEIKATPAAEVFASVGRRGAR